MKEGPKGSKGVELVVVVDAENNVIGEAPRQEMRRNRLWHRATYVFVFDSAGRLHVQKRTMTKDVYPGYWDPAAGGVVLAGESCEEAARRELEEELGISNVPLRHAFDFRYEDEASHLWGGVYECVYDGPLRLQQEEVEDVVRMTPDEIQSRSTGEPFTPDGLVALKRLLGLRQARHES